MRSSETNGSVSVQDRYFLTSHQEVEKVAYAVRAHWGIENNLHWVLDWCWMSSLLRIRVGLAWVTLRPIW
jgi:predicted transposase YbfD/YdcC